MYQAFGLYFYKLNPELFKEDVTDILVENDMIKTIAILESRMRLDGNRIDEKRQSTWFIIEVWSFTVA
jgi:predicted RNA-binding protein